MALALFWDEVPDKSPGGFVERQRHPKSRRPLLDRLIGPELSSPPSAAAPSEPAFGAAGLEPGKDRL